MMNVCVVMRELGLRSAFAFDEQFREAGFRLMDSEGLVAERRAVYRTGRLSR